MRLIVMFDIPTLTPSDKRNYRVFRKFLLSEGFLMHQFSIYTKILSNDTNATAQIARINKNKPSKGLITCLKVTEKQYSRMIYIHGDKDESVSNTDARVIWLGDPVGEPPPAKSKSKKQNKEKDDEDDEYIF